jgi:hypothetical protein
MDLLCSMSIRKAAGGLRIVPLPRSNLRLIRRSLERTIRNSQRVSLFGAFPTSSLSRAAARFCRRRTDDSHGPKPGWSSAGFRRRQTLRASVQVSLRKVSPVTKRFLSETEIFFGMDSRLRGDN